LARNLKRSVGAVTALFLPLFGALIAGILAMAFHEFFDFSFHIPSNALLVTVLAAMAMRLGALDDENAVLTGGASRTAVLAGIGVSSLLIASLFSVRPADYDIEEPASSAEAVTLISAHPGRADLHLSLLQLMGSAQIPSQTASELNAILWLQPTNPHARDRYAAMLIRDKHRAEGLNEITRAVYYSPDPSNHPYLAPRIVRWLSPSERAAIEAGFDQALSARFNGAVDGLGSFYDSLSWLDKEARLYEAAAGWEQPDDRLRHLLAAGHAHSQAGELAKAEQVLRQATSYAPTDPMPYQYLAVQVFAPRKQLAAARKAVDEGINNGADAATLLTSLADAASIAGNGAEENAALLKAVALRPASYDLNLRLGSSYLGLGNCDRAVSSLQKATELKPQSAEGFDTLGAVEEQCYQFDAAEGAYERAAQIQPSNMDYRQRLENFHRRLAENKTEHQ
jgi:tetratricopeptide (TPR) repeat protein